MSADIARPVASRTAGPPPWARWAALVALLGAEAVAMMVRFDTGTLALERRWWSGLLENLRVVPQLGIAAAAATTLLCGARLRGEWHAASDRLGRPHRYWPMLLGHLAALANFVALTVVVLEGDLGSSPHAAIWLGAWALAGMATAGLWAACLLPVGALIASVRRVFGALLVGLAIGGIAWGAGQLTDHLWRPLGRSTLWAAHGLLSLACRDVACRPAEFTLSTPACEVTITPSCSGYEGIGLILVFIAAYLRIYRRDLRFPQALLLLPLGTAVIWLANAVRIAALVVVGTYVSNEVAEGGFHSQAGWLAFNAAGLGLVALSRRSGLFTRLEPATDRGEPTNPTAAYLAPLLAIVAATMITAACSAGFDWLYPLRVPAAALALGLFWRSYADLRWSWSWTAVAIGVGVFALWMALEPAADGSPAGAAPAAGLGATPRGWAIVWLVARVVGSVVTVPLAEELAFRGYLTRRLISADFTALPAGRFSWPSFLASSTLFGVLHGRWLAGTLAGMLYAGALYRRGRLADAVLAHATTNALIAAYVLATGSWDLWA